MSEGRVGREKVGQEQLGIFIDSMCNVAGVTLGEKIQRDKDLSYAFCVEF